MDDTEAQESDREDAAAVLDALVAGKRGVDDVELLRTDSVSSLLKTMGKIRTKFEDYLKDAWVTCRRKDFSTEDDARKAIVTSRIAGAVKLLYIEELKNLEEDDTAEPPELSATEPATAEQRKDHKIALAAWATEMKNNVALIGITSMPDREVAESDFQQYLDGLAVKPVMNSDHLHPFTVLHAKISDIGSLATHEDVVQASDYVQACLKALDEYVSNFKKASTSLSGNIHKRKADAVRMQTSASKKARLEKDSKDKIASTLELEKLAQAAAVPVMLQVDASTAGFTVAKAFASYADFKSASIDWTQPFVVHDAVASALWEQEPSGLHASCGDMACLCE